MLPAAHVGRAIATLRRMPDPRSQPLPALRRSPVPGLARVHQLVLPTPWVVGALQAYLVEGDPLTLIDTGVRDRASRAALEAAFDALFKI